MIGLAVSLFAVSAFALYQSDQVSSLQNRLDQTRQTSTTSSDGPGLNSLLVVGPMALFPNSYDEVPGTSFPIARFNANQTGLMTIQIVSTLNGTLRVTDGGLGIVDPFLVGDNTSEVSSFSIPISPGNVMISFQLSAFGDGSNGPGGILPVAGGNFTIAFYY